MKNTINKRRADAMQPSEFYAAMATIVTNASRFYDNAHSMSFDDICEAAAENMVWDNVVFTGSGSTVHYEIYDQESLTLFENSIYAIIEEDPNAS